MSRHMAVSGQRRNMDSVLAVCCLLYSGLSSYVLAANLGLQPAPVFRIGLFLLLLLSFRIKMRRVSIGRVGTLLFLLFSVVLSISILYGSHITIEGSAYSALVSEAYIMPFGLRDLSAFLLNSVSIYILATAGFVALVDVSDGGRDKSVQVKWGPYLKPVPTRRVVVYSAFLFILWLPYLLTYWPGFILGDSVGSIAQALGLTELTNHHPVVYTLFIRGCLDVANALGFGNTVGCALYSILQMAFMSVSLSFAACWMATRTNHAIVAPVLVILLGFSPYVAGYAIAMWKDPLFSTSLVIISLLLCDLTLRADKEQPVRILWYTGFFVYLAIMTFIRSNGVFVALFILCALVLFAFVKRAHRNNRLTLIVSSAMIGTAIVLNLIITGPLYQAIGVLPASRAESLGIPLNQMARVAALDGSMSESDRAYMDELLPLERYENTYRPCCIDLVKLDPEFNAAALDNRFLSHWLSMFLRNPKVYLDAWIMQSFGWWTVNQIDAVGYDASIAGGVVQNNNSDTLAPYDIWPSNLLESAAATQLFPMDEWSIPIGWVFWIIVYFTICACASKQGHSLVLAISPSLGLIATLLIASPIWYWPRYAFAVQLLLPLYLILFVWLRWSNGKGRVGEEVPGVANVPPSLCE